MKDVDIDNKRQNNNMFCFISRNCITCSGVENIDKKKYTKPALTAIGSASEITRGGATTGNEQAGKSLTV